MNNNINSPARWLITWQSSEVFDKWYEKGIVSYWWGERIGDFGQYSSANDIQNALKEYNRTHPEAKQGATTYSRVSKEIWMFLDEMKDGDIIYVKGKKNTIIAKGVIDSDHTYEKEHLGLENANIRKVKWSSKMQCDYPSGYNTSQHALLNITEWNGAFLEKLDVLFENTQITEEITKLHLQGATREAVVKERIGQGYFRERLLYKYKKCCLCSVEHREILRASHIKPWSKSIPDEQCDVENGLLLCTNHDSLFDKGFISFDDNGNILISERLSENEKYDMNINTSMRIDLSEENKKYMDYHRTVIFNKF